MPTLLLMRHAKSDWGDPHRDDHDRPLNDRGKRDAPRMGRWLSEQGLTPTRIVCSSARRARQTAERLVNGLGVARSLDLRDDLYLASVETWLDILHTLTAADDCLLGIGHNPGLEELVSRLSGQMEPMPTAAIAVFDVVPGGWTDLGTMDSACRLRGVWRPKELEF